VEVVGLVPDRLRLRLDARDAAEHHTAPSSTRSERSTSMVKSRARRVDEVYVVSTPFQRGGRAVMVDARSRSCGIQSICASAVVDLADLVDATSVVKETLA